MHPRLPFFAPTQDVFEIGVTLTLSGFAVTLEHGCYHPVSNSPLERLSGFWGGHNRIFVTIGNKP